MRNDFITLDFIFVLEKLHQGERFHLWLSPDAPLQTSDPTDRPLWRRNGFPIVARLVTLLRTEPRLHLADRAEVVGFRRLLVAAVQSFFYSGESRRSCDSFILP